MKDGVYYFIMRVPNDLRHLYAPPKISFTLRTRFVTVTASYATHAAEELDEYWHHLRANDSDLPGKHMLRMAGASVKLSEAVSIQLRLKGKGRSITFQRSTERWCGYSIEVCGDKNIAAYTEADANAFRGDLLKLGLTSSSINGQEAHLRAPSRSFLWQVIGNARAF